MAKLILCLLGYQKSNPVCVHVFVWLGGDIHAKKKVSTVCVACLVSVKLMPVCLPFHGLQSSSLLCVTSNALLMHLAPMRLQFQRKPMTILQGTRCWISGSKWKRSRTSLITGTKNRASTGREGVKKGLPASQHQSDAAGHIWKVMQLVRLGLTLRGKMKIAWDSPGSFSYRYNRHWIWGSIQTPTRN